jgi:hypothetical protein
MMMYLFLQVRFARFNVFFFFSSTEFFLTVGIRASLHTPRLISRDPEVND